MVAKLSFARSGSAIARRRHGDVGRRWIEGSHQISKLLLRGFTQLEHPAAASTWRKCATLERGDLAAAAFGSHVFAERRGLGGVGKAAGAQAPDWVAAVFCLDH